MNNVLIVACYEHGERSDRVTSIERNAIEVRRRVDVYRNIIADDVQRGVVRAIELTPDGHRLSKIEVTYIDAMVEG